MSSIPRPVDPEDHRLLPVSLDDLKEQLRIEHDEQDRLLLTKILAATDEAEQYIGAPIMLRSYAVTLAAFPSCGDIELPHPNVRAITSVGYYDTDSAAQTVDSADYELHTHDPFPTVRLVPDAAWPDTQTRENAVTVTYVAGYANKASAVPAGIREAVILRAATRTENSEEAGVGMSVWTLPQQLAFERLLAPHRVFHV